MVSRLVRGPRRAARRRLGTTPRVSSRSRAVAGDLGEVVVLVRLEQDHQVGGGHRGRAGPPRGARPAPSTCQAGTYGIVVGDRGAAGAQLAGDRPGRRFPLVGDVPLVGHAEQQHPRAVDRLGVAVEQFGGAFGDVAGHPAVDLLGQLDEPERVAERADLIGQVVGVDGDAVAADARARVERLEAERLGGRAPDRVPQVHVQLAAEDRHLVDQGDVHVPVGVLQQLGHLRLAGRLGPHHLVADPLVEGRRGVRAGRRDPADDLGRVRQAVARGCPGRSAPGRTRARSRARRSARTPSPAAGGPPPRWCRDRWSTPATPACPAAAAGPRSPSAARTALRSGPSATDSGVGTQMTITSCGPISASSVVARNPWAEHAGHLGVGDVVHVRPPGHQPADDLGPGVVAGHPEPGPRRLDGQREADVAEPDDQHVLRRHVAPLPRSPPDARTRPDTVPRCAPRYGPWPPIHGHCLRVFSGYPDCKAGVQGNRQVTPDLAVLFAFPSLRV